MQIPDDLGNCIDRSNQGGLQDLIACLSAPDHDPLDVWRERVLPNFLSACRQTVAAGRAEMEAAHGVWCGWIDGAIPSELRAQPPAIWEWQQLWIRLLLDAARKVVECDRDVSDSLAVAYQDHPQLASVAPAFGPGFWRAVTRFLMGNAVPSQPRRYLRFPLALPSGGAVMAQYALSLHTDRDATGAVFLSPAQVLRRTFDLNDEATFANAFVTATDAARSLFPVGVQTDIEVFIFPVYPGDEGRLAVPLQGPSAGGALAISIAAAQSAVPIDGGLAVSFGLDNQGNVGPVGSLLNKVTGIASLAARRGESLPTFVVAAGQEQELKDWAATRGVTIRPVATVKEAYEFASGLPAELAAYLGSLCNMLDRTPWHSGDRSIRLSQFHLRPPIIARSNPSDTRAKSDSKSTGTASPSPASDRFADWEQHILNQQNLRAAFLGDAGSGKSALLGLLALDLAQRARDAVAQGRPLADLPVPVFTTCSALADQSEEDPVSALAGALARDAAAGPRTPAFRSWLVDRVRSGRGWLLIDGLDQINASRLPGLRRHLTQLQEQNWTGSRVLTGRQAASDGEALSAWPDLRRFELRPLVADQVQSFITKWFGDAPHQAESLLRALHNSPPLALACRKPLICSLVCLAYAEGAGSTGSGRAAIYGRALRQMLRRAGADGVELRPSEVERLLLVLSDTAHCLLEEEAQSNRFVYSQVHAGIARARAAHGLEQGAETLLEAYLRCGVLQEEPQGALEEPVLTFAHRSFAEFLAANALARAVTRAWRRKRTHREARALEAALLGRAWHPAWHEVVNYYMGLTETPGPLLDALHKEEKDDLLCQRLALALTCLTEARANPVVRRNERKALRSAMDEVATEAVSQWWDNVDHPIVEGHVILLRALPGIAAANARIDDYDWQDWIAVRVLDELNTEQRIHAFQLLRLLSPTVEMCKPELLGYLIDRLKNDREMEVRAASAAAASALLIAQGPTNLAGGEQDYAAQLRAALLDRVNRDVSPEVRRAAAEGLSTPVEMRALALRLARDAVTLPAEPSQLGALLTEEFDYIKKLREVVPYLQDAEEALRPLYDRLADGSFKALNAIFILNGADAARLTGARLPLLSLIKQETALPEARAAAAFALVDSERDCSPDELIQVQSIFDRVEVDREQLQAQAERDKTGRFLASLAAILAPFTDDGARAERFATAMRDGLLERIRNEDDARSDAGRLTEALTTLGRRHPAVAANALFAVNEAALAMDPMLELAAPVLSALWRLEPERRASLISSGTRNEKDQDVMSRELLQSINLLKQRLRSTDPETRRLAIQMLGMLGTVPDLNPATGVPAAAGALVAKLTALFSPGGRTETESNVRIAALESLRDRVLSLLRLAPPETDAEGDALEQAQQLIGLAKDLVMRVDDEARVRRAAIRLLGMPEIAQANPRMAADLVARCLLQDPNPQVRQEAARSLGQGFTALCRVFTDADGAIVVSTLEELLDAADAL